ncbi:MAG: ABC transporter permease [Anaerolineae bacterium]|jgi:simple sugar transport system permease protein|nr:ABC transporter permease [Anaerolineae bacterium]
MESENTSKKQSFFHVLWQSIGVPLGAIGLALLIGAVILLISGANPILAYGALLKGAFGNATAFSRTLEKATPLIFSGLALTIGFKAGLFNIGAQGQLAFGAITAAFIGFSIDGLPWFIHAPFALVCGALAGGLFGAIPGVLKAFTGAHEVITTIMLNYIALNITDYLVGGPWQDKTTEILLPRTPLVLPTAQLDERNLVSSGVIYILLAAYLVFLIAISIKKWSDRRETGANFSVFFSAYRRQFFFLLVPLLLVGFYLLGLVEIGFLLAIGAAFGLWWLLERTTIGFEIRMVGSNSNAAKYAGIRVALILVLTMFLAGLFAGMGGAIETTGVDKRYEPGFNIGLGFDGITISLLGGMHPLGTIPAALLVGAMKAGANTMQFEAGVAKEIIDVIQSLMLFFVAADMIVRYILRIRKDGTEVSLSSGWK